MTEDEPTPVMSGESQHVSIDGLPFCIEINRRKQDKTWTLHVVDHEGSSQVWDDKFASGKDAPDTAIQAIAPEGAFLHSDNVIPLCNN